MSAEWIPKINKTWTDFTCKSTQKSAEWILKISLDGFHLQIHSDVRRVDPRNKNKQSLDGFHLRIQSEVSRVDPKIIWTFFTCKSTQISGGWILKINRVWTDFTCEVPPGVHGPGVWSYSPPSLGKYDHIWAHCWDIWKKEAVKM